jgi:excisionase family DNA binding protein
MTMTKNARSVLTVRQAAGTLGVGIRHILTLLYEGKLPGSYKLGMQWQIPEAAVKAQEEAHSVKTSTPNILAIMERLERKELKNRCLMRVGIAVLVALCAVFLMGRAVARPETVGAWRSTSKSSESVEMDGAFWGRLSVSEKRAFLSGKVYGQLRTFDLVMTAMEDQPGPIPGKFKDFFQSYLSLSAKPLRLDQMAAALDRFYSDARHERVCMDVAMLTINAEAGKKTVPQTVLAVLGDANRQYGCE